MNSKITQLKVVEDYNKLKDYARTCVEKRKYSKALLSLEMASKIMYKFNFTYTDDAMEEEIVKIAKLLFGNKEKSIVNYEQKKIIFYDYFALDGRGLTQQYLSGLIDLNYEILYISYEKKNEKKSEKIFSQLKNYNKSKTHIIKKRNPTEIAEDLFDAVNSFGANAIFLHTSPWDVVGISVFSQFSESKRYLINITDHAFWLGKCCLDYLLEFRSYGYNVSRVFRSIPIEKLILMPFYPIQDLDIPFGGFPFDANKKKVIFSGGALYKINGRNLFFDIIKHIIDNHEDTVFLYAGNGDTRYFKKFISQNHLNNRVFLISERKDISQLIKNCYFYVGTYPLGGGLMTQLAVANKKVPIVFTDEKLLCNYIEPLFINVENKLKTYSNLKDYYEIIDKLIVDPGYMKEIENSLNDMIITKKDFAYNLLSCINKQKTKVDFMLYNIEISEITNLYLEIEDDNVDSYNSIFIDSKNIGIIFKFLDLTVVFSIFKRTIKKIFNRIKKTSSNGNL